MLHRMAKVKHLGNLKLNSASTENVEFAKKPGIVNYNVQQ